MLVAFLLLLFPCIITCTLLISKVLIKATEKNFEREPEIERVHDPANTTLSYIQRQINDGFQCVICIPL